MCSWIAALSLAVSAMAAVPPGDAAALLARADAPHDDFKEGVIRLRVAVTERGKPPLANLLELFVKGSDASLCVFREGKQQGRKILTVGERVWLIVPGASRPVPVSKSQRLMGAASFGDIARLRFAEEYEGALRPGGDELVLDLSAKRKGAPYPKAVLWLDREDGLPRRLRLALASGKEAKEVRFTGYGDKLRLRTMEIRDLLAAGDEKVTSLVFESYEPKALDPALFTPEGARAVP